MCSQKDKAVIRSVDELLKKNLVIPSYQRPYKWTRKNITELILDIQKSIEDGIKYRVGTVILHRESNTEPCERESKAEPCERESKAEPCERESKAEPCERENDTKYKYKYAVVDGQQRLLSFLLLKRCLDPNFTCELLSAKFSDKVTK